MARTASNCMRALGLLTATARDESTCIQLFKDISNLQGYFFERYGGDVPAGGDNLAHGADAPHALSLKLEASAGGVLQQL